MFFVDGRFLIPSPQDKVLMLSMVASGMRRVGMK